MAGVIPRRGPLLALLMVLASYCGSWVAADGGAGTYSLDTICSELCQDRQGDRKGAAMGEVYLNEDQVDGLNECSDFIHALQETPEMLTVYEDLKTVEVVQFTEEQMQNLIVRYNSYFHRREDLPAGEPILEMNSTSYDLKKLEKDFLKRWEKYQAEVQEYVEDTLADIQEQLDKIPASEKRKRKRRKSEKRRKRSTWERSSKPENASTVGQLSRVYKDFLERHRLKARPRHPSETRGPFRALSDRLFSRRTNPSVGPTRRVTDDDGFPETFRERIYRKYVQAIESSIAKMGARTEDSDIRRRQKRDPGTPLEICPAVKFWTPFVLGYDSTGELVQITQVPEYGMKQWFQEEKCLHSFSPVQGNVACQVRFREVPAMVVSLKNADSPIQESYIKVESCAAYLITDNPP